LLLLDYWPLRRMTLAREARAQWLPSLWKLCVEKLPLFMMSAISAVITFFAQRSGGTVATLQLLPLWEESATRHQLLPLCADHVLARSAFGLLFLRFA